MSTLTYAQPARRAHHVQRRHLMTLSLLAAVVAFVADYLFYGHLVGWTAGLFTLIVLGAVLAYRPVLLRRVPGVVLTLMTMGVAAAMIDHPGVLEIIVAALCLMTLTYVGQFGWTGRVTVWLTRWVTLAVAGWSRIFRIVRAVRRWDSRRGVPTWLGLWALPLVLGAIFVALFAAANPVIQRWLTQIGDALARLPEHFNAARIAVWVVVFLYMWGLLRPPRVFNAQAARLEEDDAPGRPIVPLGVLIRCLLLFNVLFAVETVLDLMYLVGGAELPAGMDYREYARRGSYPLVATALLAGFFVLITFRRRAENNHPSMKWARRLVYLWLAQNVLLMLSAAWRLYLLVDVTMLTRLRIATVIWMALVCIGFIAIFFRIVTGRPNAWLVRAMSLLAAVTIYASCFVNFDRIIAEFNVKHCMEIAGSGETQPFYVPYHEHLGPEAMPAMYWLLDHTDDERLRHDLSGAIARLSSDMRERQRTWRGWTWRNELIQRQVEAPVAASALSSTPN